MNTLADAQTRSNAGGKRRMAAPYIENGDAQHGANFSWRPMRIARKHAVMSTGSPANHAWTGPACRGDTHASNHGNCYTGRALECLLSLVSDGRVVHLARLHKP